MYKSIVFTIIALLLTFLLKVTSAQNSVKVWNLSLKQAQDFALEHNPSIVNAKLDKGIAKKTIWETTAIGLPQLNLKGSYSNIFKVPEMNFPTTYIDAHVPNNQPLTAELINNNIEMAYEYGEPISLGVKENVTFDFTVSQLIFSGAYIVGLQASKTFYKLSEQSLEKTQTELCEAVANSYNLILILDENRRILQTNLDNLNRLLFETHEMNKEGFIEDTDADQIQLTKNNIEIALNQITQQIEVAKSLLKLQIGIGNEDNIELTDNVNNIVSSIDSLLSQQSFVVEQNVNYKILTTQEQLAKLNLRKEESEFLPTLSAFFNHQEKTKKPDLDFASPNMIGLNLAFPIVTSGQRIAKIGKRKMELEKAENTRQQVSQALETEAMQTRSDFVVSFNKYKNEKRNLELSEKIYNKTLTKYREGISTSFELTQSQNQYLNTQSNYYKSISDLLTSRNKLIRLYNIQNK